jgi:hypothetical protein
VLTAAFELNIPVLARLCLLVKFPYANFLSARLTNSRSTSCSPACPILNKVGLGRILGRAGSDWVGLEVGLEVGPGWIGGWTGGWTRLDCGRLLEQWKVTDISIKSILNSFERRHELLLRKM